ncbi:MAG: EutN/CcmL family microcompartment protein [Gemmataceae bacterium]
MRIAEVIGTVTLSRPHPALVGFRFVLAVPHTRQTLLTGSPPDAEEIVIYDDLGAGHGSRIAFAESGEAAAPFYPEKKPIDAYCAALLDSLTITG